MRRFHLGAVLVFCVIWGWAAHADVDSETVPRVSVSLEQEEIPAGQHVALRISVLVGDGTELGKVDLSPLQELEGITVVSTVPLPGQELSDGTLQATTVVYLRAMVPGDYVIPSLKAELTVGKEERQLTTAELDLTVGAAEVAAEGEGGENGALRPVAGPVQAPLDGLLAFLDRWGLYLLGILILAAILAIIYWRRRRRNTDVIVPSIPADVEAMSALSSLRDLELEGAAQIRNYHIELSEILKRYLGARFAFACPEMTTYEVRLALGTAASRDVTDNSLRILDQCDGVKFADLLPPKATCRELLDAATQIVQSTRPTSEDEEKEGAA